MAGNGRRSRSRWDYAADVAQSVRAAQASSSALRAVGACIGGSSSGSRWERLHKGHLERPQLVIRSVPMPRPVLLGGLDEPLDLSLGEIFAAASANCYIY
jgi:hypothetical protein